MGEDMSGMASGGGGTRGEALGREGRLTSWPQKETRDEYLGFRRGGDERGGLRRRRRDKRRGLGKGGKTINLASEGDKRRIHSPLWCPTTIETPTKKSEFPVPPCSKTFNYGNSSALSYEAREVRRCLLQGLIESPQMSHAESLVLAELEDKLRAAVGTRYAQDD
uniref:Uncharacterized protein n=1 Tax=Timema monikensis TaxID=170555 RepID=A0A7R9DXD2_9NEOP|nr:unnamed protein product [Timema monikensis]